MELGELELRLGRALTGSLPGAEAQALLAPRPRRGWRRGPVPEGCPDAAGLLLLCPGANGVQLVLTVRGAALPYHAGQVSLPGGAVEAGESIEAAALREAHEEAGVDPDQVRLLGRLTPLHIPVSRYVLHPVLAVADRRLRLRPGPREVARILEVPLSQLTDPARVGVDERMRDGQPLRVPYLTLEGERVWGATAMVLAELVSLTGAPPPAWLAGLGSPTRPQPAP